MTDVARLIDRAEDVGLVLAARRDGHVIIFGNRKRAQSEPVFEELIINARAVSRELRKRFVPRHEPEVMWANDEVQLLKKADER